MTAPQSPVSPAAATDRDGGGGTELNPGAALSSPTQTAGAVPGHRVASREQLEIMLLNEHVAYLERVVGILRPALEARLVSPVIFDQIETARPAVRGVTEPATPLRTALPAPAQTEAPSNREQRQRESSTTRMKESPRRDRVVDVLKEAGGEVLSKGALAIDVYGSDTTHNRMLLTMVVRTLREEGVIESVRGKHGGYRWAGSAPSPAPLSDWQKAKELCWHPDGYCADYGRGTLCGHCTDQDGGIICSKRHRTEDKNERVR